MKVSKAAGDLTGRQVRMARAALRWTLADTAQKAGIGDSTIKAIEAVDGAAAGVTPGIDATKPYREAARAAALAALWRAFSQAGMVFVAGDGADASGAIYQPKRR